MGALLSKKNNKKKEKYNTEANGNPYASNSTPPTDPPPPLPPQLKNKTMLRSLYNFEARQSIELSFNMGDVLYPMEDMDDKPWFKAKHSITNEIGLVPYNYVVVDDGTPSSLDCYYDVNRVECERLLQIMGNPSGTFIIRPSTDAPNLALSVRVHEHDLWVVRHYKITKSMSKWCITDGKTFDSISQLISYYKHNDSNLAIRLDVPLPRDVRPTVPFQELEVERNNFHDKIVLGRGNFGEVWKARWGVKGQMYVAIKVVKTGMMSNDQFLAEAQVMHELRHPRIVELLGICTKPESEPIYIITEFLQKGALLDFLHTDEGKKLDFQKLVDMMDQIAEGMSYLESRNFIHRDLRAANILVDDNSFVKVADFGLARLLTEDNTYASNESKFPVRWTAPEASKFNKFTTKSDIWSFGIMAYELITYGGPPYDNMTTREVRVAVEEKNYRLTNPHGEVRNHKTCNCPNFLFNMMLNCWDENADNRPTFEYLVSVLNSWSVSSEGQYLEQ